jgi:hypothetical protein
MDDESMDGLAAPDVCSELLADFNLRSRKCPMFAGAVDRHEPANVGLKIGDVTTAQSG